MLYQTVSDGGRKVAPARSLLPLLEDLFDLLFRHRQFVDVRLKPAGKIRLDWRRPGCVDLARRVLAFAQALVAEHVAEARDLRILRHLLGQLRRDKEHAAVAAEHYVAG